MAETLSSCGSEKRRAELLPHGDTLLKASDMIVILTNEKNEAEVHDYLEQLCREKLHSEGESG